MRSKHIVFCGERGARSNVAQTFVKHFITINMKCHQSAMVVFQHLDKCFSACQNRCERMFSGVVDSDSTIFVMGGNSRPPRIELAPNDFCIRFIDVFESEFGDSHTPTGFVVNPYRTVREEKQALIARLRYLYNFYPRISLMPV